jgi:hypothetical protein
LHNQSIHKLSLTRVPTLRQIETDSAIDYARSTSQVTSGVGRDGSAISVAAIDAAAASGGASSGGGAAVDSAGAGSGVSCGATSTAGFNRLQQQNEDFATGFAAHANMPALVDASQDVASEKKV